MVESAADLQQLKGVGRVLAKRLYDAGYRSFDRIAQAGEDGLKAVPGISPRAIGSILQQARELAQAQGTGDAEREEALSQHVSEVREKVQMLAQSARDRFQQQLSGKTAKKLSADLVRMEDALGQMKGGGKKRSKRANKALAKAEKRVAGLEDATLKKIRKSLKRARKAVQKAL